MDHYFPAFYISGTYMFAYGYDTSYRPAHMSYTLYTMPYCRDSDGNYFTVFGATSTSFTSYQNQGAWSCDAYKEGSSANKSLSLVPGSYIDKLRSYSNLPIPTDLTVYNSNGYYLKIPMTLHPADSQFSQSWLTLDWEDTVSLSSNKLTSDSSLNSNYTNQNVLNLIEIDSSGESGGESGVDYSSISNAIILIPATIILVFFFKMIFNIFMNRKVRG